MATVQASRNKVYSHKATKYTVLNKNSKPAALLLHTNSTYLYEQFSDCLLLWCKPVSKECVAELSAHIGLSAFCFILTEEVEN
jgi:hypothetical protein